MERYVIGIDLLRGPHGALTYGNSEGAITIAHLPAAANIAAHEAQGLVESWFDCRDKAPITSDETAAVLGVARNEAKALVNAIGGK